MQGQYDLSNTTLVDAISLVNPRSLLVLAVELCNFYLTDRREHALKGALSVHRAQEDHIARLMAGHTATTVEVWVEEVIERFKNKLLFSLDRGLHGNAFALSLQQCRNTAGVAFFTAEELSGGN